MIDVPHGLRIDSGGDQFVVSGPRPRMSWVAPITQGYDEYEIESTVDGVSRARTRVTAHLFVEWPWPPLLSCQHLKWRVRSVGQRSATNWSEWASFEAGLFHEDWTADWISPVENGAPGPGRRPASRLSTQFIVERPVKRARLYATALGLYTAAVNEQRAGTAELSPGSTSYDRTLYAQAFDVTSSVHVGPNTIAVDLSDGWYRGQVGAFRQPAQWGSQLGFRCELHLEFEDGSRDVIRTDARWQSSPSNITRADLMDGQTVDLLLPVREGTPVIVGHVDGPAVEWSPSPPVRVVETRNAVAFDQIADGVWIADFGQNASGWIRLADLGPAGTRTTIDYGEYRTPGGDLSTSHLDAVRPGVPSIPFVQRDEIVSDGSAAPFEPRHTVHGFQFARITRQGTPLTRDGVAMQVVQSDLRRTGTFQSSNQDLNRLYEIADWSFRGNSVDVPTDCPTRERLAWTGDYQVFAPTATRLYDVLGFSRKWLRSVRDDQLQDGRIANFSPDGRQIKHHVDDQFAMMTGSAGWGDAIVAIPWELYRAYGDPQVLSENWDAMVGWVEWELLSARSSRHHSRVHRSPDPLPHEQFIWDGSFHWGEWTEPKEKAADGSRIDPMQQNPMAWFMADKGEVGTAYLYRSTWTIAEIAARLGRDDDALRYREIAAQILDAWRVEFLREGGRTAGDTQAGYVRALTFGLVPDGLRNAAAGRLVELIRGAGMHLGTGFLSTGDLLPVLVETGHADIAYELLFQRSAPSWLYMVDKGATTIWEDWEGIDDAGRAHESLNHYSKGAVVRFLHTHVLGLRQAEDSIAWKSFVVAPVLSEHVTSARGTHDGPHGTITVEWESRGRSLEISVDVPSHSVATLIFPNSSSEQLGPGKHHRLHDLDGTPPPISFVT